jgi:hypothetical protein
VAAAIVLGRRLRPADLVSTGPGVLADNGSGYVLDSLAQFADEFAAAADRRAS